MLDAKHEFEVDMERAGWQPEPADPRRHRPRRPRPPRRRAGGAGASGSAGTDRSAGRRRRPAQRADPDEVTRTLANLADLRDRGAITPEEYEAKKADLLSRL